MQPSEDEGDRPARPPRVVGIGASAGGVAALKSLFRHMAPDTGLAFVVVSHLATDRESSLVPILQGQTAMPTRQLDRDERVQGNHVYVIRPGADLLFAEGQVRVVEPEAHGRTPIDRFFRSLAEGLGHNAACVVLSGTGADGTIGLKRIKEEGGLTMVQSPEDAEYDSMPRNALATGLVDLALPTPQLAERLATFAANGDGPALAIEEGRRVEAVADTLRDILTLVRIRSGHDFSNYKRATLLRRVSRRMQVCETETIGHYHSHLREHPAELAGLLRDFLISVTNFFRDADVFEAVEQLVIPRLFTGKDSSQQVRIWVPACATGEEAYSLAILAAEHASRLHEVPQIQIFATDIDDEALTEARTGRYPETIAADVGVERLERFFVKEGTHYRIRKEIREMVLFSPHNVLRDPPFSKLDLVTCRNLLIYLNREAQERVIGILHFGLRPDGILVLGSSESAESAAMLFAPVDAKQRIYVRRPAASQAAVTTMFPTGKWQVSPPLPAPVGHERAVSFGELHHRLVEYYAPPSVLVNEEIDIVHLSEHAGRYLIIAGGEPTRHLLRLILPDLRLDLRAAIYAARQPARGVDSRPVLCSIDGKKVMVQVTVRALEFPDVARGMMLILFDEHDVAHPANAVIEAGADASHLEPVVRQLEDDVLRTREQLRTTVEQYETSVEELKASNEELHAINEELRSATEELETSKEELQSVNEELITVNHELKEKVDEVSRANSDLQNLMTSTDIGVLFLDRDLNIKLFTPRAQDLFNLIPSDIGRPLAHITHRLECDSLGEDSTQVLQTLRTVERDVRSKDCRRYLARVHPYRSLEDRIDGVVLTFVNVTELKRAEDGLRSRDAMLHLAERAAQAGSWDLDVAAAELRMSEECSRLYGLDPSVEVVTIEDWLERIDGPDRERVRGALAAAAGGRSELDIQFRVRDGHDVRSLWHLGKVIGSPEGRAAQMAGITVNITGRIRTEAALRASEERFRLALRTAPVVMLSQDSELRYTWGFMMGGEVSFLGKTDAELFPADEARRLTAVKRDVLASGIGRREEIALTMAGTRRYYDMNIEPIRGDHGVVGLTCAAFDVTTSKLAEIALRDADRRKDEFLATLAHELRNPLAPLRAAIDMQKIAPDDRATLERSRAIMDRQVNHIVRLVEDLLDLSRISQGKVQIRRLTIAVQEVVTAALEATRSLVEKGRHELIVDLPEPPLWIDGDLVRLTQALTNLIGNAAKYTRPEGRITVRAAAIDGGQRARVSIQDTGIGIAADMLPRVFDMFTQVRDAAAMAPGGLGIGLTLARHLVEHHGGTLEACSEGAERGTELVVTLPASRNQPAGVNPPASTPAAARTTRHRVLVVDDNPDVTDTISEVLEMIGHTTRQAPDGPTALAVAAEFHPDIVLLDLGLPGMSGFEVAQRLRALGGEHMTLVALTGWGAQDDLHRSREAGFDRHIVKPAGLDTLREVVGDLALGPGARTARSSVRH